MSGSSPDLGPLYETYSGLDSRWESFRLRALGTDNVFLLPRDADGAPVALQRALETIESFEARISRFLPESEVSLVNRLGVERAVSVGDDLLSMLRTARWAHDASGGAFDPTIGPLLERWGLDRGEGRVPERSELDAGLELTGLDHVVVDERRGTVRLDRPGVSLDLGAIGKGFIIDRVARDLRAAGIESGAIVSGRSTVVGWGCPREDARWRVQIADPFDPGEGCRVLACEPGAVSTSAGYERRVRAGVREIGHVIDPRTGEPVDRLLSATVWTSDALLGDVISTALFVLGSEALEPGGALERLAAGPEGREPPLRVTALLLERDPSAWGGMRFRRGTVGRPGFHEE